MRGLWYLIVLQLARFIYFLLGGYRGFQKHNVPKSGGVIIAPIHLSHLDPPLVACVTRRQLRFMAKEELFKGALGWLIRSLGAFPVKRGEGDTESIRLAIGALEAGEAVLMFPEGTRGDGKTLGALNKGVAMIAKRTGAPVVPISINGTHLALPKGSKKLRRASFRIRFGEPLLYSEVARGATEKENRELFLDELARRLITLSAENGLPLAMPEAGK
jgi:1-acyl-sn-glycerol-3-phosphate acyltransferase